MIAKVIVLGNDRAEAIEKMKSALDDFVIEGVKTTIPFHQLALSHPDFIGSRVTTQWVESVLLSTSTSSLDTS
jgi:acetyl-CoA carboxylase biotin carboxylase subunit